MPAKKVDRYNVPVDSELYATTFDYIVQSNTARSKMSREQMGIEGRSTNPFR